MRKWILGNRYLEEQYAGSFMGQPFTGLGFQGYDNVAKRYVGTWMDTMSTGMMMSTGTMNGKVIKSTGSMADPLTGKSSKYTMNMVVADNDKVDGDQLHPEEITRPARGARWAEAAPAAS